MKKDTSKSLFRFSKEEKQEKTKKRYGYITWEKEAPRISNTRTIGSTFSKLFQHMGMSERIVEQQAVIIWPEVVGKHIANASEAISIKDGILTISVKNPSWKTELKYMKKDICKKLNKTLGRLVVSDIKIK
ncbi:MAG: DUF721 domain-containing protein [Calditrichaeota bacterium]|jgi:predicted nucleic acid-binding Zn ribbon protein|nr:DUF721 domain-containing protein [Calditrichota bacterium]MBT7618854.1 DUF721 domain-containing protein [Calditrichota bacterium]